MSEREEWPEYVMLRDTKLHDDMGGAGQRIYTTAGQGYEKIKYVRADLLEAARAPLLERITALENKCALLAASWQKAEDELEEAVRDLTEEPHPLAIEQYRRMVDAIVTKPKTSR
jgi:anti-sigma factor RsiW